MVSIDNFKHIKIFGDTVQSGFFFLFALSGGMGWTLIKINGRGGSDLGGFMVGPQL